MSSAGALPGSSHNRCESGILEVMEAPSLNGDEKYRVMSGWRVGHLPEEMSTRSGLLVPAGTEKTSDALALIDVHTGQRFWAVPTGAWRFLWPETGKVVVAVRDSQIIAEEKEGDLPGGGVYL